MFNVKNVVNKSASLAGLKFKKASPKLMAAAGVAGLIVGTVMACKATLEAAPKLEKMNEELEHIRETKEERPQYGRDLTMCYGRGILGITKSFVPTVVIDGVSLYLIGKSVHTLDQRFSDASAAVSVLSNSYNGLVKKLGDELGEDKKNEFIYGMKSDKYKKTIKDENGKTTTETKKINIVNPDDMISPYSKFFDESNPNWSENPQESLNFLRNQERYANALLKSRGYLFLNEVYRLLGLAVTDYGQIVGWLYDPKNDDNDNYVSFGIYDSYKTANRRFINGDEQVILLDFNVDDEPILNRI